MKEKQKIWERHPLSAVYKDIPESQFEAFAKDVRDSGQTKKGKIFEGKVLDGWQRNRACLKYDLEFQCEDFKGTYEDAVRYVLSENSHRRHLTDNERMVAGAELAAMLKQTKKSGRNGSTPAHLKTGHQKEKRTDVIVSKALGISGGSLGRAVYLKKHEPEIFAKCKAGEISVANGYRTSKMADFKNGDVTFPNSFSWWHEVDQFFKSVAAPRQLSCVIVAKDGKYEAKFIHGMEKDMTGGEYTVIRAIAVATLLIKDKII